MGTAPTPSASSIAVVANRQKLSQKHAGSLRAALRDAGHDDVPWISIDKGKQGTKAAQRALDGGARTVIVCGGDGTVRAAAQALVGTGAALAVVPEGTANLFAGSFAIPSDPAAVVDLIVGGHRRTIDTGRCNGLTFVVMAGAGFDAAMIDDADDTKERYGTLAYVRSGVRSARQRQPFAMEVTVDGQPFFEGEATCVLVGNTGRLKAGVQAFPDASVTDGRLDVAVLTASGMREWAGLMVAAVRHRQHLSGHAQMGAGTKIVARFSERHRFELDGGTKGRAKRLKLRVVPASLVICAPTL
jgi:diacylglycerol kinase (ATP)